MQQTPIQQAIEKIKEFDFYGWSKTGMIENKKGVPLDDVFILRKDVLDILLQIDDSFKTKLASLLPTEQQYLQQHAEGFLEWFIKSDCEGFDGTYWIGSTLTPISELYTKYINSLK